jgi:hypothetical protein
LIFSFCIKKGLLFLKHFLQNIGKTPENTFVIWYHKDRLKIVQKKRN